MMLSASLVAQNMNNDDIWKDRNGNVCMTPEAAIDKSKIVSDWLAQSETLEEAQESLKQKDAIINEMLLKSAKLSGDLKAANEFIEKQTAKVDELNDDQLDIADKQIDIAKGLFTNFNIELRAHGNLTEYVVPDNMHVRSNVAEHIRGDVIVRYNISKFYVFAQGSVGTDDYKYASFGAGYRFL